jgi:ERCC4-type nuclease
MGGHGESARRYRDKAEELRAMIPHTNDQNAREILETIASNYDLLASVQENLAKLDKAAG